MADSVTATMAGCLAALVVSGGVPAAAADSVTGPAIPGYQRFHSESPSAAGGHLLLGELNCTACHAADAMLAARLTPKPAPVLDEVAVRVKPEYLRRYLADPHAVEPGTTMPNLFIGVDPALRDEQVEALVHFLASGGTVSESRTDVAAVRRGDKLFHTVGCAVCHGARREGATPLPTDVPLPDLVKKYSIGSLAAFLEQPHAVRPGGRMPDFGLDEKQAADLANFLIPDANPKPKAPRVTYRVYTGSFPMLPDFEKLEPSAQGQSDSLDIRVAGEDQNYAIVFEGFLKIDRAGEYWFRIGSDDGSRLLIDGEVVANHDGPHAYSNVRGARKLEPGVYPVRVEYAQVAGDQKLAVQFEGPGLAMQSLTNATYLTAEAKLPQPTSTRKADARDRDFELDPALAGKGRELFASLGCASCHQKKVDDAAIASSKRGPALAELQTGRGCLAASPASPAVDYAMTAKQRQSIVAALAGRSSGDPSPAEKIDVAFTQFNCYACHVRGEKGGVEAERNDLFETSVPEMGDEGRIPPHLTGVGDKLKVTWLRTLLADGANDRTYMRTRMPTFGIENVGFLADAFAAVDQRTEVSVPAVDLPQHRVESVGRQLVGESALSCIKCHNFGPYAGTGIQAIDLQTMTRRLRQDWFVRYMPDPQQYRPGTRMPSAFPNGKSVVRDTLAGDAAQQLAAIWTYLELGEKAPVPAGTVTSAIVLTPKERPIVYRGFLEGLSPRGIAVGYPERANIAFDAGQICLALIWHNDFLDASKHWAGRGDGTQLPLGDHVLSQVRGVPLAVLGTDDAVWPGEPAAEQGWQFRGYRLDQKGRPVFHYGTEAFRIKDALQPVAANKAGTSDAVLHRVVQILPEESASLPGRLYFRVAAGETIEPLGDNGYRIDESFTLRLLILPGAPTPIVRASEGRKELLIPVASGPAAARIEIDYEW